MGCFKIIIVDDDGIVRNVIAALIKNAFEKMYGNDAKTEITTAESVYSAYQILENKKCDLLITDCEMPDIDGIELIKRIRKKGVNEKIPILGMSGEPGNAKPMQEAGANGFIAKPIKSIGDLIEKIKEIL